MSFIKIMILISWNNMRLPLMIILIHGILDSWLGLTFVYEMVEIFVHLNSSLLLSIFEFMHVICWRFKTMFGYHAYLRNIDVTNWISWKWMMIFLLNITCDIFYINHHFDFSTFDTWDFIINQNFSLIDLLRFYLIFSWEEIF